MDINKIEKTLKNIVPNDSAYIKLHDFGNYPMHQKDSYLYKAGNGELLWARSLGLYSNASHLYELEDSDLEVLLNLLLDNGIISKETYNDLLS